MGLFGRKKKEEVPEAPMPVVPGAPAAGVPTDRVIQLRQQGMSNNQITETLQREGYSSSQIYDAMSQADIKGIVETPAEEAAPPMPAASGPEMPAPLGVPAEGAAPSGVPPMPGMPPAPGGITKENVEVLKKNNKVIKLYKYNKNISHKLFFIKNNTEINIFGNLKLLFNITIIHEFIKNFEYWYNKIKKINIKLDENINIDSIIGENGTVINYNENKNKYLIRFKNEKSYWIPFYLIFGNQIEKNSFVTISDDKEFIKFSFEIWSVFRNFKKINFLICVN